MSVVGILRSLAFLAAVAAHARQEPPHHPVLMISIDGMRPDYVTHAGEHGLKIPTLRSFLQNGTYADGVTGVFPTITYPSHTTLVTGVWPDVHGIVNNQRFDPERKFAGAWYWYADAVKVPTLWSAAHAAGESTASVGWPVTVDARDIDWLIPEYWRGSLSDQTNPDDRFLIAALSRPDGELARIALRTGKPYMDGNDTMVAGDETKTIYALDILSEHKPSFMTIHLSSLDEEEHLHGTFSAEADADLEQLDGMVARLIAQERANDLKAVVAIVSDHGFTDVDRMLNLGAAFVNAGLIQLSTNPTAGPVAWKAQPWAMGCMFAIMLHDPEDASVKEQVRVLLAKLAKEPQNGIEDVFGADQVKEMGGAPDATFVVTLRKGYAPGPGLTGNLVTTIPGHHGAHGYNPLTTPEMRASFFIEGPDIAKGKDVGIVDMRNIAPTIANLLGVNFTEAKRTPIPLQ